MKTFAVITLGCKVNQYESQQIRQLLQSQNMTMTDVDKKPDMVVVNTCCVTHIASSKSRQQIRKSQKQNPDVIVVIAGCLPVAQLDELKGLSGNIEIVPRKQDLPTVLVDLSRKIRQKPDSRHQSTNLVTSNSKPQNDQKSKDKNHANALKTHLSKLSSHSAADAENTGFNASSSPDTDLAMQPLKSYHGQKRAFLKIQDGCDGCCSYCIIPKIRTNVCNKDVKIVLEEAKNLVQAGHKEIVLTGIFLGAYGQSTVRRRRWDPEKLDAFPNLLDKVAGIPHLERLRLSSLEPADVTDSLLDVFSAHHNILPHLHLPLQSGSPVILRKMARQYTLDDYIQGVEKAYSRLDRPAITTDIIVGFPGESDADFEKTLQVAEHLKFAKIHVFPFSPRKNTPAEKMSPKIPNNVKKQRSAALRALDEKLQADFRKKFINTHISALIETQNPPAGRSRRYFMVTANDLKTPKIHENWHLTGTLKQ